MTTLGDLEGRGYAGLKSSCSACRRSVRLPFAQLYDARLKPSDEIFDVWYQFRCKECGDLASLVPYLPDGAATNVVAFRPLSD